MAMTLHERCVPLTGRRWTGTRHDVLMKRGIPVPGLRALSHHLSRWLCWRTSGRAGYPASRTATSAPHRSTHCANM